MLLHYKKCWPSYTLPAEETISACHANFIRTSIPIRLQVKNATSQRYISQILSKEQTHLSYVQVQN